MEKLKFAKILLFVLLLSFAFTNCGKASRGVRDEQASSYSIEEKIEQEKTKKSEAPRNEGGDVDDVLNKDAKTDNSILKQPQKIIKTAHLSYRVEDINESYKKILNTIKKHGAIVSAENQENVGYRIQNSITIRVMPEKLDTLVTDLTKEAIYIDYKRITADNVTAEYVDAQSRLKTKKEVELRYIELLKRANTIGEILNVERELRVIREEIEAFEGKLKVMNDQIDFSTINLNIYQEIKSSLNPDDGFFSKIWKAIKGGWKGLQLLIVGLLYLWPLLLGLGIGTYFLMKFLKRNKKKQ